MVSCLAVTRIDTPIIRRLRWRREVAASVVGALLLVGCNDVTGAVEDTGAAAPVTDETTVTGGTDGEATKPTNVDADTAALFDSSVVHEVALSFEQADYDAMIEALAETGEKEWIEVTVTIDGVTYERAGARLKGNSSLAGLSGGGPGQPSARPRRRCCRRDGGSGPTGWRLRRGRAGGLGVHGLAGGSAVVDSPRSLRRGPGASGLRRHRCIRSNGSAASLNEAVALDLLDRQASHPSELPNPASPSTAAPRCCG